MVLFIALCLVIHGRFKIKLDLEGWISLHPHCGIYLFRIGLDEVTRPYFVLRHPFHFGIIFLFRNALDVTLVKSKVHLLFTSGAFAPTALVLFGSNSFSTDFDFVGLIAVGALYGRLCCSVCGVYHFHYQV